MLLRNISTEKTMQVDSQIWYCLEICGEKERREIFISLLDEEISGITENNDNSLIATVAAIAGSSSDPSEISIIWSLSLIHI